MKILPFKNKTLTVSQKFFIERAIELLYRRTIDSYRVRVMNPKTILTELLSVTKGLRKGRIKDYRSWETCRQETVSLLKQEKEEKVLKTGVFDVDFLIELLKDTNQENFEEKHKATENVLKEIIKDNENYGALLAEKLKEKIAKNTDDLDIYLHYNSIDLLTGFLITELIANGYSKSFLFKFFYSLFVYQKDRSFDSAFEKLTGLTSYEEKNYRVWFKLSAKKEVVDNLNLFGNCKVSDTIDEQGNIPTSNEFNSFKKKGSSTRFIKVETTACDHYSALRRAKHLIAENLDVLHLGFSFHNSSLIDRALVQDQSNPDQAEFHKIRHQLDGRYKSSQDVFEDILSKVPGILNNEKIENDTKEKIKSAIRYLRLGNEAIEIEHQFINYWIGMEYLFSNYKDSTFTRIKELLPCMQTIIYVKRNLREYHNNVSRVSFEEALEHFTPEHSKCLASEPAYEEIRAKSFNLSPLLSYRSWFYKNRLFKEDKRKTYIEGHRKRLEQHLIRLYRVRNEIIHEARHNFNNEALTSNLKYYLTFALGIVIDHFHQYQGEQTALEDFFVLQSLKLSYLKKRAYPLATLLDSDENFELLNQ
jgi:hypothetical protein